MNTVLYTRDMEPITIIDLPIDLLNWATNENGGYLRIAVRQELQTRPPIDYPEAHYRILEVVGIEFQRLIMRNRDTTWLAIVDNDEFALKLKPSWLPGQQAKINYCEKTLKELAMALLASWGQR